MQEELDGTRQEDVELNLCKAIQVYVDGYIADDVW
jgi:hypothetical protein